MGAHRKLETSVKRLPVVILAGGKGTRLRALKFGVPKPLAPVRGRPFLERSIRRWRSMGYRRFIIICARQNRIIRDVIGSGETMGVRITYCIERVQRGTGMAILESLPYLPEEFILLNGDTYIHFLPHRLVNVLHKKKTLIVLAVTKKPGKKACGRVQRTADGRVTAFHEKERPRVGDVFTGVSAVCRKAFLRIPKQRALSYEREILPLLIKQRKVAAIRVRGDFSDIGTPASYKQFCLKRL